MYKKNKIKLVRLTSGWSGFAALTAQPSVSKNGARNSGIFMQYMNWLLRHFRASIEFKRAERESCRKSREYYCYNFQFALKCVTCYN